MGLLAGCSGGPNGTDDSNAPTTPLSTDALKSEALSAAENTAYAYFVNKGLTSVQSAAIVGNLIQESDVLPGAVEPGGPGRGIAQWSVGGRWDTERDDNVEWYAGQLGLSATSLTLQLDFIWYELETFSGYGLASLKASTTLTSAVVAFEEHYEGCGECDQSARITYAEEVLSSHGGTGGTSGGGGTGTGCYSSTLGREVVDNTCVQSRADDAWYQCDNGSWVDRYTDPDACDGTYPL